MSTEQELNEYLAEEIMNWTDYLPNASESCSVTWYTQDKYPVIIKNEWNPLENLKQAFEVLEEYIDSTDNYWHYYQIETGHNTTEHEDQYRCMVYNCSVRSVYWSEVKTYSIIGAICHSEGIYEDYEGVFNND